MMTDQEWSEFESLYCKHDRIIRAKRIRNQVGKLASVQMFRCGICGEELIENPTVDHVIPRSRGGFDGKGNVVAACFVCNNRKADRMPTGCELIYLIAVNCRMGWEPQRW